jgi:DNA-binding NtrC family response regulator
MAEPFVMLVDDEVAFVEAMARRLDKRKFEVISAFSGSECLQRIKENKNIDVIVLDIKMPGMDGIETLRNIKHISPLIEVLMLTGHATVETAIEGMKLGAYDFLLKPCDIEELVSKIKDAAKKKNEHEEKIKDARDVRIKEILKIYDS